MDGQHPEQSEPQPEADQDDCNGTEEQMFPDGWRPLSPSEDRAFVVSYLTGMLGPGADTEDWAAAKAGRDAKWSLVDAVRLDFGMKPLSRMAGGNWTDHELAAKDRDTREYLPRYKCAIDAIGLGHLKAELDQNRDFLVMLTDYVEWRVRELANFDEPLPGGLKALLDRGASLAESSPSTNLATGNGREEFSEKEQKPATDLRATDVHAEKAGKGLEAAIWLLVRYPDRCRGVRERVTAEKIADELRVCPRSFFLSGKVVS